MILIISKKNDLISYGFYNAFKTIYKNVDMIYTDFHFDTLKDYKIIIVNNYDFLYKIPINIKTKYILINENCIFENRLKVKNINYIIVKEYSSMIDLTDFKKIDNYMYNLNNLIIMPYCSIFTKNQILWHYKKQIITNKNIPINIVTYENTIDIAKKLIELKYEKSNIKKLDTIINRCYNEKNIYITNYDSDKIDYKSLSFMSLGNFVMTDRNVNNTITLKLAEDIKKVNLNKIVQNIEIIYNDFTFEKYVKLLNYFLLSV